MMKYEWLTAESFERTHALISAINRLAIHNKLALANMQDAAPPEAVREARETLRTFLDRFGSVVHEVETDQEAPVLGTDPRLGLLARRYVSVKQQRPDRSLLYTLPLDQVKALLDAELPDERRQLVECLRALRSLVEEHAQADVVGLLGEL
jgi:hypothetical protein